MKKIRKGDEVTIITGKDKGRQGRVLKVLTDEGRVLVEGVNMVKRHTKPDMANPNGGVIAKEAALHISNVAMRHPQPPTATRVGFKVVGEGAQQRKVRVAKGSGVQIDV